VTLKLLELTKKYNDKIALNNITFSFTPGIYGLLGPNGAGKSTMMNLITDSILPTSGQIFIEGKNIKELDKDYRKLLGYMPQQQNIYPELTLLRFMYFIASLKGLNKREAKKDIEYYLKMVNLYDVREKRLGTFSGGMRQRVMIAAAMVSEPKLLIADEPTTALDVTVQAEIIKLLLKINELSKVAVLFISHDLSLIRQISHNVMVMQNGVIVEKGDTDMIFESPKEEYTKRLIAAIPKVRL
jgi:ABC-type multidrug transport system ATPase subunit